MKRLALILLLCSAAWATTGVTGHVSTLGGTVVPGTFVRFWLRGCGGNQPRVGGVTIFAPTQGGVFYFDIPANAAGDISGIIYSTRDATGNTDGEIECGGSHTATWYGMQMFYAGKGGPETPIAARNGDTIDISNITPITTNPVVTAPTGDTTYARLDSGNQPFTGGVTSTSLTTGNVNGLLVVDGVHYTTIAQALAALPAKGGTVYLPNGYRETFTSSYTLGDGADSFVTLVGGDDVTLTCNVTDGTFCFKVKNGSGIVSQKVGRGNSGNNSGFVITYPNTINVASVITSDSGATGGQGYLTLEGFFVNGQDSGGTISTAVVNIENVLGQSLFRDFYVTHFNNTIGVRIASSTGGSGNTGTGPLDLINVFVDGDYNAGARPLVVIAANAKSLSGISIIGGTYNHPGSGLAMIEVNGNSQAIGTLSAVAINTYVENFQNGSSIAVKLRDVTGVNVQGLHCSIQDTDTCIDISESAANRTAGIRVGAIWKSSATNLAKVINNQITGESNTNASIPTYFFGGEASTSQGDTVFSGTSVRIRDLANHNIYSLTTDGNLIVSNSADAQLSFVLNSGSTAAQNTLFLYRDRGTDEWSIGKDTGNSLLFRDRVNSINMLTLTQNQGATFIKPVLITPVATSALPTCNGAAEGAMQPVNDSNSATFNATFAGSGTNHVIAYCNGTNWTVH